MLKPTLFLLLLASAACAACNLYTPGTTGSTHNYTGAAIFGGTAVAAAGANRAVTGDCWASCPTGRVCNRETGTCDLLPCSSHCPADLRCERVGGEEVCVQPKRESLALPLEAGADSSD
jgi:hypothetical protein